MAARIRTQAIVSLLLCAGASLPVQALAQPAQSASSDERPLSAWTLLGIDLHVQNRWRGVVRVGHLGDIDSRVLVTDLTFVARPAARPCWLRLRSTKGRKYCGNHSGESRGNVGAVAAPSGDRQPIPVRATVQ